MEKRRLELHEMLCELLGSRQAYYNPPASVRMRYPAIVYSASRLDNTFANNGVYTQARGYEITVIDEIPDSEISEKVSKLSGCRFNKHFVSEDLHHDVYTLYY